MNEEKKSVYETLKLLSSVEEQDKYYKTVEIADIVAELVNQWFDDCFLSEFDWFKELFTKEEWEILISFHEFFDARVEKLPETYPELKENFFWKEIVGKAKWTLDMLGWSNEETKSDSKK